MNLANGNKKEFANNSQGVTEPQSAHATPVVEKYIKKRHIKAEKQIKHEINNSSTGA